jgi:hypothetical protein
MTERDWQAAEKEIEGTTPFRSRLAAAVERRGDRSLTVAAQ